MPSSSSRPAPVSDRSDVSTTGASLETRATAHVVRSAGTDIDSQTGSVVDDRTTRSGSTMEHHRIVPDSTTTEVSATVPVPVTLTVDPSTSTTAATAPATSATIVVHHAPPEYDHRLPYSGLTPSPSYSHVIAAAGLHTVTHTEQPSSTSPRAVTFPSVIPAISRQVPRRAHDLEHADNSHLRVASPWSETSTTTSGYSSPSRSPSPDQRLLMPSSSASQPYSATAAMECHRVEHAQLIGDQNPQMHHEHQVEIHFDFEQTNRVHERLPSYKTFSTRTVIVNDDGSVVVGSNRAALLNQARRGRRGAGPRPNALGPLPEEEQHRAHLPPCPANRNGHHDFVDEFTCSGVLCAVLFFPCMSTRRVWSARNYYTFHWWS